MKKILIAVAELMASVVLSSESSARDLERELWFYADFDSPMRVDGNAYFAEGLPVYNEIEGKFGKAQYFPLGVANRLPPMKALFPDGYPVALTGGVFTVPPQKIDHPFAKWDKPAGTYTCSFYAKGRPGTTLTLEATLSPSATGDVLRVDTYVLTASVQRVWTWAKFDRRTVEKRKIALKVMSSGPVELERFQYERTGVFGRMSSHPGRWTEGGTSKDTRQLVIKDRRYFSSYPGPCGSFSAWIRRFADDYDPSAPPMVWGCKKGSYDFGFNGDFLHAGNWWHGGRMPLPEWQKLLNVEGWHHVAGTWSPERQALWVDGTCVASTAKKMALGKEEETIEIHVGGGLLNGVVGDVAIDDLAVFRTLLTDEEIKELAKGERPVLAAPKLFVATPASHTLYHRDQTNAALRLRVVAPTAGEWTLEGEIAGRAIAGRKVSFGRGVASLAVPFEPARLKVGVYPWKIALRDANRQVVLARSGELEILPRLDRDGFLYMSWGGNYAPRTDFLKTAGFNAYILSHNADTAIDAAVRNGFYVNVRYENGGTWKTYGFGPAAEAEIAAKAARDLAPLEGLHAWRSTLINSEVYYYRASAPAFAMDDYLAEAHRALGFEPDFCILRNGPAVYDYRARRESVPKGVLSPTNGCMKALATLDWFNDDGQPFVRVAGATAPTVRRISGGGAVWTEPLSVPSVTKRVDMVADWFYNYANRGGILKNILWRYGQIRTYGKAFMPTLGMYFDEFAGFHPTARGKDGKPLKVCLSPSVDDYQVKCWIALGATRLDALSVFSADTWDRGAEAARAYLADPSTNVFQRLACVAEPDAPERSGDFVRNRILPAAELLRGYETMRAPIALLVPSETFPMSGTGWQGYHYPRAVNVELAESCMPYDIVADLEMTPEILSKYRYIAWPLASVARPEHDAAVRAAAERGSTVVLDDFAELTYPGAAYVLKREEPVKGKKKPARPPHPYRTWFTNHTDDVRALLPSLSSGDLGDGFTFEKRQDGVRFVIVANDKRRPHEAGGFLTQFCTNATYRPYGAPQKIVTTIRDVGEGAVVYEFNGGGRVEKWKSGKVEERKIEREFAPGEGVVYCVYPEPLRAPDLSVSRRASSVLNLAVRVATTSGKPAPARTVLKVEVREASGALREESGLYRAEKGVAEIPIRLADGEKSEGLQVSVVDLTTGLCVDRRVHD